MGEVKLLDCTLRDGGYVNDWRFGKDAISEMIGALERSHVDILEVGFLKDEPYKKDRTVFRSMKQVKALIADKKPGTLYAVMCEAVNPLPLEMLAPADSQSADIIRVIVWKSRHSEAGEEVDALREGYEYCKGIVEKGYKLCVQPARVSQYSDEEFIAMIKMFSRLNPMAIYVVDSWGTESAESLLRYMELADPFLPAGTALGYHGHNNRLQAFSVAERMLSAPLQRDLILDASVYGIGRGAGNLNTELIAQYMNERLGRHYDIQSLAEIYDRYLKEIYSHAHWGYSLGFFMTARYHCNPNYAVYYEQELGLPAAQISKILAQLNPTDRVLYARDKAQRYWQAYQEKQEGYLTR